MSPAIAPRADASKVSASPRRPRHAARTNAAAASASGVAAATATRSFAQLAKPCSRASTSSASVALSRGGKAASDALLTRDPTLADRVGGPLARTPLLCLCWSSFADGASGGDPVATAHSLLARGADADARCRDNPEPHPTSALYGASCKSANPALAAVLLAAGADPTESLYPACENRDLACLRLLLADPRTDRGSVSYCLMRMLDFDSLEGVRMLLDAGADPTKRHNPVAGDLPLLKAVRRPGRDIAIVRLLIARGGDPAVHAHDGVSAYALARRAGNLEIAELVRRPGDDESLTPAESFVAACGEGDGTAARRIADAHPGLIPALGPQHVSDLTQAAWRGRVAAVRAWLAAGVPVGALDRVGATLLHTAAYGGHVALVDELIARGAPLDVRDAQYRGTPVDWACAGSGNTNRDPMPPDANHVAVVERLAAVGAPLPERAWGSDAVIAALRARGST